MLLMADTDFDSLFTLWSSKSEVLIILEESHRDLSNLGKILDQSTFVVFYKPLYHFSVSSHFVSTEACQALVMQQLVV